MGIARLFTQTVAVETYLGVGIGGATYSDPVDFQCFINDSRQMVRNANGEQVVSETTLYAPLGVLESFPVLSRVTCNGRAAFVISAYRRDSAGPASAHHAQITLT